MGGATLIRQSAETSDRNGMFICANMLYDAEAVLEYKKKRVILNRSYQKVADTIVGKMTIASSFFSAGGPPRPKQ